MAILISKQNQSIFDVCLQAYGSLDFMDNIIRDNPTLNYDSEVLVGDEIVFDETIGILQINTKRDLEDISFTNGDNIFEIPSIFLSTTNDEFIVTTNDEYIELAF